MEIGEWLRVNSIQHIEIKHNLFLINGEHYIILSKKDIILNENFDLVPTEEELDLLDEYPEAKLVFYFGNKWYWSDPNGETTLNPFRHIGEVESTWDIFLGVHGKFELLNGTRDYKDWCKKAKFLGVKTLGICELQTLAGTMAFQEACNEFEIKPVIGHTALVENSKEERYTVKLYVKNKTGWRNLLKVSKEQNVTNHDDGIIKEDDLMKFADGLVAVLNPDIELVDWLVKKYNKHFEHVYYNIDLTKWEGEVKEKQTLLNIQHYLDKFYPTLKPVIINDAYYLDSIDVKSKKNMNIFGKVKDQYLSSDQHFKSMVEVGSQFFDLFNGDDKSVSLYNECLENVVKIGGLCDFQINTKNRYLPKYKMTDEESKIHDNNEEFFNYLVLKGFEEKILPKLKTQQEIDVYIDRIDEETEVLLEGNVADYFLILSDICMWARKNGILVGHGRGSAGGSAISYCLNVTEIDPIEYDLLFSRFLTRGRLKGSLPDIDVDFSDRDRVVAYMKERYGNNFVASVGTYGNLKVKNAIKDFGRVYGLDAKYTNYITGFIKKDNEAADFTKLMRFASTSKQFKKFVNDNPQVFEDFDLVLHQTRTASIHACATLIVPDVDEEGNNVDIFDLVPTKLMDGELVTEWEGAQLEKAGFLKEDILGLKQLEKFDGILKLIKQNYNKEIDIYQIDLTQPEVFEMFQLGLTEDVFQFGSDGLKSYCKYMQPDSIEELTAANALYRPGAMESNAHKDFVEIKFDRKSPMFDFLLEDIAKTTYGLYIYQEQIMKAYAIITESDLEQADKFRKYITKAYKLKAHGLVDTEYEKYQTEFVSKYVEKGQNKKLAEEVWDKLVAFSNYGFNRSHSAAYSIISYISQWFKVNYPLEFWATSLNESIDDDKPKRISEIEKGSNIAIKSIDINKSKTVFEPSVEDNSIYWSLIAVKNVGEKAVQEILEKRNAGGAFFDIAEFVSRVDKRKANKRVIEHLILGGAFDQIHNVQMENERFYILDKFFHVTEVPHEEGIDKYEPYMNNLIWWQITQFQLTGFGGINYKTLANKNNFKDKYCENIQDEKEGNFVTIAGIVTEVKIKTTKKGDKFAIIFVNCNNEITQILAWNDIYEDYKEDIEEAENKVIMINGKVRFDTWNSKNSLNTHSATKLIII